MVINSVCFTELYDPRTSMQKRRAENGYFRRLFMQEQAGLDKNPLKDIKREFKAEERAKMPGKPIQQVAVVQEPKRYSLVLKEAPAPTTTPVAAPTTPQKRKLRLKLKSSAN